MSVPMPSNIPPPVIYGPAFPDLVLRIEKGRQVVDSRTNDTLYLGPDDFDAAGNYTLGRFLANACRRLHWTENCTALVVDESDGPPMMRLPPAIRCPSLARLVEACQTETSRRFMQCWIKSQGGVYMERGGSGALGRAERVERSLLSAYAFPRSYRRSGSTTSALARPPRTKPTSKKTRRGSIS